MKKIFESDKYSLRVTEGTDTKSIPVYTSLLTDGGFNNITLPDGVYKEYDGLGMGTHTVRTYFASFEFENSAAAEIKLPSGVKNIKIKPENAVKADFSDGIVRFCVSGSVNFVIDPDGDIFGGLRVFCNKRKPMPAGFEHEIIFRRGLHTADNCDYIRTDEHGTPVIDSVPDNTLIYIADGAVVNAAIVLRGVHNVHICGAGTLSLIDRCHGADRDFDYPDGQMWGAFRYWAVPNVYVRSGSSHITVEDIVLNCEFRGVVLRNCEHIALRNVKMFTSTENADGINCYNTSQLLVDGCWIESADDCFCMYNSCDSIPTLFDDGYDDVKPVCRAVEVKNCVMSSNARPIVLGGHATGSTNPRCVIEDIHIHDCRIIETPYRAFCNNPDDYSMYWSGFMRILSQSEQIVRGICFENMVIEVTRGSNSKPVHIEVRGSQNASYTENSGYRIENIMFRNIQIKGSTERLIPSVIRCRAAVDENDNCGICGVTFDNLTTDGRKIGSEQIVIEGNCEDIRF